MPVYEKELNCVCFDQLTIVGRMERALTTAAFPAVQSKGLPGHLKPSFARIALTIFKSSGLSSTSRSFLLCKNELSIMTPDFSPKDFNLSA